MTDSKKAAYQYINDYQKKQYDRITILRKAGEKKIITEIAKNQGYRTVTEFINYCIDKEITAKDSQHTPQATETAPQATETAPDQPKENKADYLPLTDQEINKIDLVALVNDVRYQCDLLKIYGQEQIIKLYQKAKDQEYKPDQTDQNNEDIFF